MADCTTKHHRFNEVEAMLPAWLTPGTEFRDNDGDPCIYLGTGGWRSAETTNISVNGQPSRGLGLYAIVFHPVSHIFMYRYKNEWFQTSFERKLEAGETWTLEIVH